MVQVHKIGHRMFYSKKAEREQKIPVDTNICSIYTMYRQEDTGHGFQNGCVQDVNRKRVEKEQKRIGRYIKWKKF